MSRYCDAVGLRNDALSAGNMESLGFPVKVQGERGLVTAVSHFSHFRDKLEVANVRDASGSKRTEQ